MLHAYRGSRQRVEQRAIGALSLVYLLQCQWSAPDRPTLPTLLRYVSSEAWALAPAASNAGELRDIVSNPLERRALDNFHRIAKEGRKYGVGMLVVSQRPADISTTILSQCNNFISLRLTNRDDQAVVRRLMPESLEGILEILPALDIGEAVVVGDAILLPTRVKLSEPKCKPLSATIDFWRYWKREKVESDLVQAVENMRRQARE